MNIVLTGSIGHIGKPLAKTLVAGGHSVTIVSSNPAKKAEIESIGAKASIGSLEDAAFLTETFTGADLVYLMEPPANFMDSNVNMLDLWQSIAHNYVKAIEKTGIQKVIHLSSIGGHTDKGNGMLAAHYYVEQILRKLSDAVSIKFMRPVGFYYNTLAFIPVIKNAGTIIQNYGGDDAEPWVSPLDIADAIADEVEKPFEGKTVRYIASEEISPNNLATLLGTAIGKPDLKWTVISDEEFEKNLLAVGLSPQAAKGVTEMNAGRRNGALYEDYFKHRPILGKVKVQDFAKDFAQVYNA